MTAATSGARPFPALAGGRQRARAGVPAATAAQAADLRRQQLRTAAIYAALVCAAMVFLFPFLWSALTSFKTQQDAVQFSVLPTDWTMSGYTTAFGTFPFARYFLHSALLAVAVTVSNVFFSALGGYAFARLRFPGSTLLFAAILGTMMIPDQVRMVPVFRLIKELGLINNYAGVWIIMAVQPFGLFLMRQHFLGLPKEMEEAARIDGAGYFTTFWKVMLPLTGPALATLGILTFQGAWNEFFWPLLILQDDEMFMLPQGLAMFTSAYETQWPPLMAATVIATLPIMVLYVCFQKYFVGGMATGAVKG